MVQVNGATVLIVSGRTIRRLTVLLVEGTPDVTLALTFSFEMLFYHLQSLNYSITHNYYIVERRKIYVYKYYYLKGEFITKVTWGN